MSMFAIVLTAVMVVPATGPEKVSLEMVEAFHLNERWDGVWRNPNGGTFKTRLRRDGQAVIICLPLGNEEWISHDRLEIIDEGDGKIRGRMNGRPFLGLCRQQGDSLRFCYRAANEGRAVSFEHLGHCLLILHRVNPASDHP